MKSRPGQHNGPSLFERGRSLLAPPSSRTGEKYRHELKYLISWADKAELTTRMSPVLKLDPHATNGGYFIRSLYFDDYWNTAYEEKDAGVLLRKKYRIRIYNCSDRSIKLERKKKFGSYIYKEAAPLTHAEFDAILAGDYDFLLHSPRRLCQEFYTECVCAMCSVPGSSWITTGNHGSWMPARCALHLTRMSGQLWAAGIFLTPRFPPCRCWSRANWSWRSNLQSICRRSCGISSRPVRRS